MATLNLDELDEQTLAAHWRCFQGVNARNGLDISEEWPTFYAGALALYSLLLAHLVPCPVLREVLDGAKQEMDAALGVGNVWIKQPSQTTTH